MNYIVVPATDVPSGGTAYDRRLRDGLGMREIAVHGEWPRADPAARSLLAAELEAVPDGATVLLDGLVAGGVPDVLAPHAQRVRLVVLVHLLFADETGTNQVADVELHGREHRTLHLVEAVIATSSWSAQRVVERHHVDPRRVHTAAPGVDRAPLAAGTDGATNLLCVASVTPRKGQELLAAALGEIAEPRWRCSLVGPADPRYSATVRRACPWSERLRFAGVRTGIELEAEYAAADLFVSCSHIETFGMALTEATARGIPVLATETGAVREALGGAGLLVPPGDVTALAAALRRWFREPELREQLRAVARSARPALGTWEQTFRAVATVLRPDR